MSKSEIGRSEIKQMMLAYDFNRETIETIEKEALLPPGLLNRLHNCYPQYSGFIKREEPMFAGKIKYTGLKGFREIIQKLNEKGIQPGAVTEREFFLEVYRFM